MSKVYWVHGFDFYDKITTKLLPKLKMKTKIYKYLNNIKMALVLSVFIVFSNPKHLMQQVTCWICLKYDRSMTFKLFFEDIEHVFFYCPFVLTLK